VVKTAVGDRRWRRCSGWGITWGETVRHMIFRDFNTTGMACCRPPGAGYNAQAQPDPVGAGAGDTPQVLVNVRVAEKIDIMTIPRWPGWLKRSSRA
jgi:hypothetical protein